MDVIIKESTKKEVFVKTRNQLVEFFDELSESGEDANVKIECVDGDNVYVGVAMDIHDRFEACHTMYFDSNGWALILSLTELASMVPIPCKITIIPPSNIMLTIELE